MSELSCSQEIALQKDSLRKQMRAAREGFNANAARLAAQQASEHLLADPCIQQASCVALYASVRQEMGTRECIEALWEKGVTVLVPRCDPTIQGLMDFIEVSHWQELSAGRFGLCEAARHVPATTKVPDVLVLPALAVDKTGHRLGQGGGYYDRFLMNEAWSDVTRIALVYSFQIVEAVPHVEHDIRIQAIAYEGGIVWLSK